MVDRVAIAILLLFVGLMALVPVLLLLTAKWRGDRGDEGE